MVTTTKLPMIEGEVFIDFFFQDGDKGDSLNPSSDDYIETRKVTRNGIDITEMIDLEMVSDILYKSLKRDQQARWLDKVENGTY